MAGGWGWKSHKVLISLKGGGGFHPRGGERRESGGDEGEGRLAASR
jgi:hypothetical protein